MKQIPLSGHFASSCLLFFLMSLVIGSFTAEHSAASGTLSTSLEKSRATYVSEFSWRDRHGTDWVTPVKDQGYCKASWAFAGVATIEHHTNLFFNRHIDTDLSEQEAISCNLNNNDCYSGDTFTVYAYASNAYPGGISDETCFPYKAAKPACNTCSSPSEKIKIKGDTRVTGVTDNAIKQALINKGPLSADVDNWTQSVAVVGYKTVSSGDSLFTPSSSSQWQTASSGNGLIGKTAWLVKNSEGTSWGDEGFAWLVGDLNSVYYPDGPITSEDYSGSDVACTDTDNDGYYFWGTGSKPGSCPSSANAEADGDDSDSDYGPMDAYGNLQEISAFISISSPQNEAVLAAGTDITIQASVSSLSSPIKRVEFFRNGTRIGTDQTAPYSVLWQNASSASYTLTAKAYLQNGQSMTAPDKRIMVRGKNGKGTVSRSLWNGVGGNTVQSLTDYILSNPVPDKTDTLTSFETLPDSANSYGEIISGYIHPPVTGDYIFRISGDDECELYLGTNSTKVSASLIASVPEKTARYEWVKYAEQTSAKISLTTDRMYYVEARHKEDSNTDHVAVQWSIPGFTTGIIDSNSLSPYSAIYDQSFSVTFQAGANGSISGDTNQTISYSFDSTSVTAVAVTGYRFSRWTGDFNSITNPLTIQNVTKSMTILAEFEEKTNDIWTVRFVSAGNGTISGNSTQQIPDGDSCTSVTATPDANYRFSGWTGDFQGSNPTLLIPNIGNSMVVQANFVADGNNNSDQNNNTSPATGDENSGGGCFILGICR